MPCNLRGPDLHALRSFGSCPTVLENVLICNICLALCFFCLLIDTILPGPWPVLMESRAQVGASKRCCKQPQTVWIATRNHHAKAPMQISMTVALNIQMDFTSLRVCSYDRPHFKSRSPCYQDCKAIQSFSTWALDVHQLDLLMLH